jgi:hypothetical protein
LCRGRSSKQPKITLNSEKKNLKISNYKMEFQTVLSKMQLSHRYDGVYDKNAASGKLVTLI